MAHEPLDTSQDGPGPFPPEYVNCGIPQGSPLSVILFLIYIDSIPIDKDSDSLFVDDCALLSSGPSLAEATSQLQERLNAIEAWARPRHISFNPEKCLILPTKRSGSSSLRLTFYDIPLPVIFEATYLGIKFQTSSSSTPGWKLTGHSSDLRNKAPRSLPSSATFAAVVLASLSEPFESSYKVGSWDLSPTQTPSSPTSLMIPALKLPTENAYGT